MAIHVSSEKRRVEVSFAGPRWIAATDERSMRLLLSRLDAGDS